MTKFKFLKLWKRRRDDGTVYYGGRLGPNAVIAEEVEKDGARDPDMVLYLTPREEERESRQEGDWNL